MDYNLCDYNTITALLKAQGFTFSKALGQNFLIDEEICPKMAKMLNANKNTGVIEIGTGVGVLTKELCKVAGKVVAIELDKRLFPILNKTLEDYSNFELVEGDVLKLDLNAIIAEKFEGFESVKICANLPYYITSPVIMTLLESKLPIDEIEVMVQKEAGQRLCAEIGTRDAGAVSVAVNYYAKAEILFEVGRESFMPSPNVDSAVIKIVLRDKPEYSVKDEKRLFQVVKGAFAQRRKTLANSLSNTLGKSRQEIADALIKLDINPNIRAEKLKMEDFVNLTDLLF